MISADNVETSLSHHMTGPAPAERTTLTRTVPTWRHRWEQQNKGFRKILKPGALPDQEWHHIH